MKHVRRFWPLVVLAVSVCFTGACSTGESTTGPSTDMPTASAPVAANPPVASPAPVVVPEAPTGEAAKPVMNLVTFSLIEGTATIRNNGTQSHWAGLALYRLNGTVYDQTFLDEDFIEIKAGKQKSFKVDLPDDGTCVKFQLDPVVGLKEAIRVTNSLPNYSGDNLLDPSEFGGYYGQVGHCSPPTPPPPPTYNLAITKIVKEKACAPSEQSASVTFEVGVTNLSSVAVSVNVSDPVTPSCNRSALALNSGQNTAYTCTGTFPAGQRSNTATASIVGQSVSKTAVVNFTVDICPPNDSCQNYPQPTIIGDIASDVQPTHVVFTQGTVAPAGGSFSPVLPQTISRPAAGQPDGSFTTTYTLPYGPPNLHCSVSKPFTKSVPPQGDSCENYPTPTITGSPSVSINPTTVTVTAGNVAPTGGTFTPALPLTVERPPFNQPAGSWNTTYSLPYGPGPLHCTVTKPFNGPVPPKDPPSDPCEGVGNPTFSFTKNEAATTATVTSNLTFPGGFTGSVALAPAPVSGFPGGSVSSGANNNSLYNRPQPNQPPLGVSGTWQVKKNEQVCKTGSANVTITPECRTCQDVKPKVACTVSGNDAQCTVTWFNPGSGSIRLDSGSWQSVTNGETVPFRELSPGNHTAKLKVLDGSLTCEDTDHFTIEASGCLAVPATSTASQPFGLPNSSPTTETNWVNANVNPGPYAFGHKDENGGPSCKAAGSSAKVVLLKAGQNYWYFLNVTAGQQLCSSGQGISHLTYFNCAN